MKNFIKLGLLSCLITLGFTNFTDQYPNDINSKKIQINKAEEDMGPRH
jgi:hypothetical protein